MIEKKPELFEEIDLAGEDSYWYFSDAYWICNKSKWDDMLICDHLNEWEKDVQCVRVSRGKIVCDTIERMAEELLSNAEAFDRDASFDEDGLNVSYEVELLWDEA